MQISGNEVLPADWADAVLVGRCWMPGRMAGPSPVVLHNGDLWDLSGLAPTKDRKGPGEGFTHLEGDVVRVSSPKLGCLINEVTTSDKAPAWAFGTRALMASLAARGLLKEAP